MMAFMGDLLQRLGELMDQGGFVMWPLLFMSVFTIALCFERLIFWLRVNRSAKVRFGRFMSCLHDAD